MTGTPIPREPAIGVVVPVFGSTRSLVELVGRLQRLFDETLRCEGEIVLVDDGSETPESWATIEGLAAAHPGVKGLQLTRNFGRPAAVLAGLSEARGSRVVVMDDDLQHRPESIPALLAAGDHDVVIAHFPRRYHPLSARLGSFARRFLDRRLGVPPGIVMGSFLVIRRPVVDALLRLRPSGHAIPDLLFHVTRDAVNVEVEHAPREYGEPAYTLAKRIALFRRFAVHAAEPLLSLTGWAGLAIALTSAGYGTFLVLRRISTDRAPPGWTSLMVAILVFGGTIIAMLGLLGSSVLKLLHAVEGRPHGLVRRRTGESP